MMLTSDDIKGIIPATILPMTEDYKPDLGNLKSYMKWLEPQGISAVAVNAELGEAPQLSWNERLSVVETVKLTIGDSTPIISGLLAINTDEAVQRARDLKSAGADAVLVFPIPAYQGHPLPFELPYQYHSSIAEADIPMILFNLTPSLGGVILSADILGGLVEIPQVIGLKEASFDAQTFVSVRDALNSATRRITLLTGNDPFIYESMVMGADGALIGFGTLATELQVRMFKAAQTGDYELGQAIWDRLLPLEQVIFGAPARDCRARIKAALTRLGIIDRCVVRPPLLPLSQSAQEEVWSALAKAELLDT
jgi:4-hydroxy-tetrahydrodipicolinate synthase